MPKNRAGQEIQSVACDDCGAAAEILVLDVKERDTDYLCWPCMARRMVVLISQIAEAPAEEVSDALGV
ncbi:MAG: hypothetical protein ACRDOE_00225 [Streptosporangiaceae bacterium]